MNLSQRVIHSYLFAESKTESIIFNFFIATLVIMFVVRLGMVFSYDAEITGIDNNFIYPVIRMLKGFSIYPDPEQFPFAVNPYAPLLFYLSFSFCTLFGISAGDTIQVYFVTRGICLVADLLTLYLLYKIITKHCGAGRSIALACCTCFFYLISYWSFTVGRSDSLTLCWFALLLNLVLNYINTRAKYIPLALAFCCTAAIFSKQSAVYMPFMITGILLISSYRKAALVFLLYFAVLFTAMLFVFMSVYPKGHFFDHLVRALNNRIDIKWYYLFIFKRLVSEFPIVPFAIGSWLAFKYLLFGYTKNIQLLSFAFFIAAGFSLLIALKWGSSIGYLNESFFAISCLLAFALQQNSHTSVFNKTVLPSLFLISLIMFHVVTELFFYHLNDRTEEKQEYANQKAVADELLGRIGNMDRYVFAADVNGTFFKNVLQEKAAVPNQDAVSCCTLPDGNFNYQLLKEGFQQGKIQYLIFREGERLTPFQGFPVDHYSKWKTSHGFDIYLFKE